MLPSGGGGNVERSTIEFLGARKQSVTFWPNFDLLLVIVDRPLMLLIDLWIESISKLDLQKSS